MSTFIAKQSGARNKQRMLNMRIIHTPTSQGFNTYSKYLRNFYTSTVKKALAPISFWLSCSLKASRDLLVTKKDHRGVERGRKTRVWTDTADLEP